jgi:hypothetical protein
MSDDKMAIVKGALEAGAVIAAAVPVYKDAIQPAAKEIGNAVAVPFQLLNTVLRPVKTILLAANIAYDDLDARLIELLRGVPPEKLVEPAANVAGPLLLAYPFVQNDPPLREMFERLLATAMNVDTRHDVHPSFVEIVRQLTKDEALLPPSYSRESRKILANRSGRSDIRNEVLLATRPVFASLS